MVEYYLIGGAIVAATGITARAAWPTISPTVKGFTGEFRVRSILAQFWSKDYVKIHNLLIPGSRDTTQIDHVLVTRYGIFVIETKNYSGRIKGSADSPTWYQTFPKSRLKPISFLNPLYQNNSHIRALRALLRKYPNIPFHSLVVFSDKSELPMIENVVKMRDLKYAIEARCYGEPVLTQEQVQAIGKDIRGGHIKGRKARDQHDGKAFLAKEAAKHMTPDMYQALMEEAKSAPMLTFGEKKEEQGPSEQFRLTDAGAVLNIRGRNASIEDFFEGAKRDANGERVPKGADFNHFICPYTGDKFPKEEAKNMYQGLWIAYLKQNQDLVAYLNEHGPANLGGSYRCKKVLSAYANDRDGFIADARATPWYQNMAQNQRKTKPQRPLQEQINDAQKSTHGTTNYQKHHHSFSR